MRYYMCINEDGLKKLGTRYFLHLAVTVKSCLENTHLKPVLIYDGNVTDQIKYIEDLGCEVIFHELSFKGRLEECCVRNKVNFSVASGAFLRMDIPLIDLQGEYALYTDVDVVFRKNPDLSLVRPQFFAAAPEMNIDNYNHINSGVLVINLKNMRGEIDAFVDDIISKNLKSSSGDPYDQGHLNDYFRGRVERLDPKFNWKPYWGYSRDACIIHWHGVKYPAAKAISLGRVNEIKDYHPHPEIYDKSPFGYSMFIKEFEELADKLPSAAVSDNNPTSINDEVTYDALFQPPSFIVGPSHTVRWNWHVRDGVVECSLPANRLVGLGGAPIWSQNLLEAAEKFSDGNLNFALLVPDFRFGNSICSDQSSIEGGLFQDGCLGIDGRNITEENDKIL